MLPKIITTLVGWAVAIFYDVERTGEPMPDGPVLVAANHPNALIDPLVIFRTAGRITRPLAKAPLFEQALVGTVLKGLGGLPVYRRQDDPARMHLNDRTFDAAIDALREGGAVQIYPEGQSHSEPSMAPLRTGAARIALMAEERSGWSLGLRVQPVGLTYTRKHLFRGRAIAAYGAPIPVAGFAELYRTDPREAVRRLTGRIREGLRGLTLNFDEAEDRELVEVAERLYARGKRLARPRERERMAERLPRLHRFAEGLHWMRENDPERFAKMKRDVSRYMRMTTLLGVTDGDVPSRYGPLAVATYALRQAAILLFVLPPALMGMAVWAAPFFATRRIASSFHPKLDQVATYKVSVAILAFPLWLFVLCLGVWLLAGWRVALLLFAALPLCGLAVVAWRDRRAMVQEDVRVFLRSRRRKDALARLADERRRLVQEFDAIGRVWRAERATER